MDAYLQSLAQSFTIMNIVSMKTCMDAKVKDRTHCSQSHQIHLRSRHVHHSTCLLEYSSSGCSGFHWLDTLSAGKMFT